MINGNHYLNNKEHGHALFVGIFGNLGLGLLKIGLGLLGYSTLVLMDGIISMSLAGAFFFTWNAIKVEQKVFDKQYAFGYGKVIFLFLAVAGMGIMVIAVNMFIYGLLSMGWSETHLSNALVVLAAAISITGNELLYRYLTDQSKEHSSNILAWNARNNRINALSSALVLFCVVSASLGAVYMERTGVMILALIMFGISIRMLRESFHGIMDKVPTRQVMSKIKAYASAVNGVKKILDIKARHIGTVMHVEIAIGVEKNLSMKLADKIAREVEIKLMENIPYARETNVILHEC